jgi:C_GCAxxG_C_C family probable redox protein
MPPTSKQQAAIMAAEKSRAYMEELNSCAYCTMRALQDTFDLQDETLLKAAGAITGGIGGMADTCGSMISAAMMVGSVCGCGRNEGDNALEKLHYSMMRARFIYDWFKHQRGTVNCNEILIGFSGGAYSDFSDPVQFAAAYDTGIFIKCRDVVAENAAKAAELVWDELHKKKR